jgi:hypothetical protein
MNNPLVIEHARRGAERLCREANQDRERVALAYLRLLSRPPSQQETEAALHFLSEYAQAVAPHLKPGQDARLEAWTAFCQALIASSEFRLAD